MIQATNELILGFDLNEEYAQITYYHQSTKEPLTLGMTDGPDRAQLPMALRQDCDGVWRLWDGRPQEEGGKPDLCRISGIYRKIAQKQSVKAGKEELDPAKLLAVYFRTCMRDLRLLTQNTQLQVMVTVRELSQYWSDVITDAFVSCGVDRKRVYVQDYLSSFYYHTVNQKKELWYQDVALLEYVDGAIVGYVLHIDRSTRPAIARADQVASQPVGEEQRAGRETQEWNKEKDRLFFELLKKVFERRTIGVSYLVGDFFDKSWAVRSIQYLCYKRHAFQGKNLYSKGACYAAMERAGLIAGRDTLFRGCDMITQNLGMEMRIRGKETYYPMVSAGINWYEAHHVCEFIPDQEREICILSRPMAEGEAVTHMMRLPGLPKRPNRGTRLRLTVYFSGQSTCQVEVEDLGFGGLYRSSGMVWKRTIHF